MTLIPQVPGAIFLPTLVGNELVEVYNAGSVKTVTPATQIAALGGSSLTVTDNSTTVTNVDLITFVGATVSGTTPHATVTITGGGGGGGSPVVFRANSNGAD